MKLSLLSLKKGFIEITCRGFELHANDGENNFKPMSPYPANHHSMAKYTEIQKHEIQKADHSDTLLT